MSRIVSTSARHSSSVSPPAISSSSRTLGVRGQRAGQFQALALKQRQAAGQRVRLGNQPGLFQDFGARPVALGFRLAGAEGGADQQILEHRHADERVRDLVRAADAAAAALVGRQRRDVRSVEDDPAGIRRQAAGDQVEQRRLAGAVRPDHAERFALVQVQCSDRRSRPASRTTCARYAARSGA